VPGNGGNGIGASVWENGGTDREIIEGRLFFRKDVTGLDSGWQHIALTSDVTSGGAYVFYRNGSIEYQTTGIGPASSSSSTMKIGRHNFDTVSYPGNKGYFFGTIKDVRIWQRALSQTEITQIYNAGRWLGS
jgi:hypothetical protein